MKTMIKTALLAAVAALGAGAAQADVVANGDVAGYQTFRDTSTGLVWLKLDQLFNMTYGDQADAAARAGFTVADLSAYQTLTNGSASLATHSWSSLADVMGRSNSRDLIWGNFANGSNANDWGYAYDGSDWFDYAPFTAVGYSDLSLFAYQTGSATPAVPEPATWALMMLGFGGIGFALRRRTTTATRIRFA